MAFGCKIMFCGVMALLLSAVVPLLLSEVAGGWTLAARSSFRVENMPNMAGKIVLVTGANTGIGRITALELARKGATVILHGRTGERVAGVAAEIAAFDGNVQVVAADMADLASVAPMAKQIASLAMGPVDVVVLNAGLCKDCLGQSDDGFEMTKDGFELHIQVNHLAHQLLVELMLENGGLTTESRLVVVSSDLHSRSYAEGLRYENWQAKGSNYTDGAAYGQSKLANVMMADQVHARYGIASVSLHPGIIVTDIGRYVNHEKRSFGLSLLSSAFNLARMTVEQGALNQLWAATTPGLTGGYFVPIGRREQVVHTAFSPASSAECWDRSHELLGRFRGRS